MLNVRFQQKYYWISFIAICAILLLPSFYAAFVGYNKGTDNKDLVPNLNHPNSSGAYNNSITYDWWNQSWTFRFAIEINSSSMDRYWWQCDFRINFTTVILNGNATGSLDNRSIRVVEYNSTGLMLAYNTSVSGSLEYVIPSLFIPDKGTFNAQTNATGELFFPLTGDTPKNTNRTFYIYFDILEHGSKMNLYELPWDKNYFGPTDVAKDFNYRLASGCVTDTGGSHGRAYIFASGSTEWSGTVSGWYYDQYSSVVVYDWNQDGNPEVGYFDADRRQMMFYTYISPGVMSQFISQPITLNSHYPTSVSIGDVDGDGTMELVVASEQDAGISIYSYQPSYPYFVLKNTITTPGTNLYLGSLAVYDLDKDGYPEIIAGTTSGASSQRFYIWEYNASTSNYDLRLNSGDITKYQYCDIIQCGDFDHDGNVEFIFAQSYNSSSQGQVFVWQCTGPNTYQYETTLVTGLAYPLVGDVIDYDNDGRYELIVSDGTDLTGTIRIFEYLANGVINSTYERQISVDSTITPSKHPVIMDYNNDGIVELVMNGKDGRMAFYDFGTGTTTYSSDYGSYLGGPMGQNFMVLGRRRNCDAYPDLVTTIHPLETFHTSIFLTLKDNDNNGIVGARVSLINPLTAGLVAGPIYSGSLGQVQFLGVSCKDTTQFNITVQLISTNPLFLGSPVLLYNKTIQISSAIVTSTLILNVWTINFNITDYSFSPLHQGFVAIYNDSSRASSQLIANLSLSPSGLCSFQWTNRSFYNYSVFYYNPYYVKPFISLTNNSAGISHINNMTSTVQIRAPITQVRVTVVDSQSLAAAGVKVSFFVNNTDLIAELFTDGYGEVRDAQGQYFTNLLSSQIGSNYTVSITFYDNQKQFRNKTDALDPFDYTKNFTLVVGVEILYQLSLDLSQYQLILQELSLTSNFSLPFRGSAHFMVELNATSTEPGFEENKRVDANSTLLEVRDFLTTQVVFSTPLNHNSTGLYEFTLNASALGIIGGRNYYATITVQADGYGNQPPPLLYSIIIQAIPTSINFENNDSVPIPSITGYWGQNLTILITYNDSDWNIGVNGATGSCWWDYGSYSLQSVVGQAGLYSVTIPTDIVDQVGTKTLHFQIGEQNYVSYSDLILSAQILEITTTLNETSDFFELLNLQIYRTEAINFTFNYFDEINQCGVDSAFTKTYVWRQYDTNAQLIDSGTMDLVDIGGGFYVLDFDTKNLNGSRYTLFISLDKPNYSPKFGFLSFEIIPIPLQAAFSANLIQNNFSLVVPNKESAVIQVALSDPVFGRTIQGASVTLTIEGNVYSFLEIGEGNYQITFNASGYNAFYSDQVIIGKIVIQVSNYMTINQDVRIVVKMDEILPGIPLFYFLLVVAFASTILGVPLVLKGVKYAKTPPFIKQADSIKRIIQKRKKVKITEKMDYSTYDLVKNQYQRRWDLFKIRRSSLRASRTDRSTEAV